MPTSPRDCFFPYGEEPLSQCYALPAPLKGSLKCKREPKCKKSLPFRGGGPAKLVEGFCEIFCLMCEVSRKHPSVSATHCQLSTRHALRVPFQGSLK